MPWVARILPLILLAYFYCGWKIYHSAVQVLPVRIEHLKWYVWAAVGYLNLHPLFLLALELLGFKNAAKSLRAGNWFWDLFFTYPFWLGLIILVELLPWLLAMDVLKLPFYPFFKRFRGTWLDIQSKAILGLFLVLSVYVLLRVILDTTQIRVSQVTLVYRNLPAALNGLTVVHISDLQADARTRNWRMMRYIKKINNLNPDIVFFTGDLVTSGIKYIEAGAQALGKLQTKYGTYACLGDHDYWSNASKIVKSLETQGIKVFEDTNQFIRVGSDSLLVTFVTNVYRKRPTLDSLNYLMGQQPRGVLDIFVTHQPSETMIEQAAEQGYHLFLAGHTHGGQVVFKPFGITLSAPQFESPYYKGTYQVDRMFLSINNGLGLTLVPIRYRAPAEITCIKLVRPTH
jgi:predicted MPP superfamily phosphohydrolase